MRNSFDLGSGLIVAFWLGFLVFMGVSWFHGLCLIFAASPILGFLSLFLEGSQNIVAWADWGLHIDLAQMVAHAWGLH